ncbi:MAG: TPM domain-containing protein [Bdellovibrionaceae bacterium]|nr:TPM domain-containing protein [Pseudobdellovibrionaceae bacterium]
MVSFTGLARAEFVTPPLEGPVMDQIGLMTAGDRRALTNTLIEMNRIGKAQIQVLIVADLGGEAIESVAIRLFDAWKLGQAKQDNGVLFLVSRGDQKMRFEVGRGLEGAIPDVVAKRILADQVAPLFRAGRFSEGIVLGVSEVMQLADREFAETRPLAQESRGGSDFFIIFLIVVVFILVNIMRASGFGGGGPRMRGPRGGGWGGHGGAPWGGGGWGSGGGGGGWSGGGGSSAGGGASSGW